MLQHRSRDERPNPFVKCFFLKCLVGLLVGLALLYFYWPIWRSQWPIEFVGNEAWNAFLVERLKSGLALYPPRDGLISNNYPPLSFVFVALLSKFGWASVFIGRTLSIVATAAIAAAVATMIRLLGGTRLAAIVGAFWYLATMSRFFDSYVGMNDPNLFALALMIWGLTWCLWAQLRGKAVEVSFVVMAVAGFYKNSIFAAPVTAFCWLFVRDRKTALRAAGIGVATAAIGLLLCVYIFGGDFMVQLTAPRVMSIRRVIASLGRLQFVLPALVIVMWWAIADRKNPAVKFSALFVFWSLASQFLQQSGEGVSDNSEFELIAATGVGLGLAFSRAMPQLQMRRNQIAILVIVILRLVISDRLEPYLVVASKDFRDLAPVAVAVAQAETARVKTIPDPVYCSIQTICLDAGKAFVLDEFWLGQRVSLGLWTEDKKKAAIDTAHIRFEAIDPRADIAMFLAQSGAVRNFLKSSGARN